MWRIKKKILEYFRRNSNKKEAFILCFSKKNVFHPTKKTFLKFCFRSHIFKKHEKCVLENIEFVEFIFCVEKNKNFVQKKRCFVKQSFEFYVLFNTKYLPNVIEKRKKIHVIKKIKIQNSLFFCVFSLFTNPTKFHKILLKFHQFFPNKKICKKTKCVFQIFDNSTIFPLRQKTQFFFRIFKQNLSKELFIFLFLGL